MTGLSRVVILLISVILTVRLIQLQLIQGNSFIQRSAQNRFRIEPILANRGKIIDRNGILVVGNDGAKRRYLYSNDFSHVIGYMSEADIEDLGFFGVEIGGRVGKMGIEKEENQVLAGLNGGVVQEISSDGTVLRQYSQREPISGKNVQLSLDSRLQSKARQLLQQSGYQGAILAGTLKGELLTLVSFPDFDPNIFENHDTSAIAQVLSNTAMPLFNRAIGGLYPPASTFKIVTAIAGLESKAINVETLIEDTGIIRIGDFSYSNWYYTGYGRTDGQVDVVKALERSNDIYFYKAGEMTGIATIAQWARLLGFGSKTGIPLEGESFGLVPDEIWKQEQLGEDWYTGDTYITSIGQGNLQVTPLQVHMLTTIVANGGQRCASDVIAVITEKPLSGVELGEREDYKRCIDVGIQKQTLATIKEGMKRACDSGGTGWPLFNFRVDNESLLKLVDSINYYEEASGSATVTRIPVACKTGTAEIGGMDKHGKLNETTHAWITAFAPVENPEIVVTVLLEEAGQGSDKAGPLARELLLEYFKNVHE